MANWDERGDVLDRYQNALELQNFLHGRYLLRKKSDIDNSFVLAIDANWGAGKTFLLRQWRADLESSNFPVVYFDAWKNDYAESPLLGFILDVTDQLEEQFGNARKAKELVHSLPSKLGGVLKASGRLAMEIAVKRLTGHTVAGIEEMVTDSGAECTTSLEDQTSSFATGVVTELIQNQRDIRESISDFKSALSDLVKRIDGMATKNLPIFVMIDELDRCRPNYALELLEAVKHLFGIDGIYFVVGVNLAQLSCSVRAVYGADFDANQYLKRFFDQVYTLPDPSKSKFIRYLLDREGISRSIKKDDSAFIKAFFGSDEVSLTLFRISEIFELELRDLRQIVAHMAVIIASVGDEPTDVAYLFFLIALFHTDRGKFEIATSEFKIPGEFFEGKLGLKNPSYKYNGNMEISAVKVFILYLSATRGDNLKELNQRYSSDSFDKLDWFIEQIRQGVAMGAKYWEYPKRIRECSKLVKLETQEG